MRHFLIRTFPALSVFVYISIIFWGFVEHISLKYEIMSRVCNLILTCLFGVDKTLNLDIGRWEHWIKLISASPACQAEKEAEESSEYLNRRKRYDVQKRRWKENEFRWLLYLQPRSHSHVARIFSQGRLSPSPGFSSIFRSSLGAAARHLDRVNPYLLP